MSHLHKNARIFLSPPHLGGLELPFVQQAFESNYIAPLGPMVDLFESEFAEYTGIPHALALSSGTDAMHLALRCLGVAPGNVVISSSLTFIGSVTPASFLGAETVFLDSELDSWNMDPNLLESTLVMLRSDSRRVGAVIVTDLYGQCADYDRLAGICAGHKVPLVIDAAEAMGARYKDRHAGFGGAAAIFSFNGNKIMTTSGGGMLASQNKALIEKARFLSQQAREPFPHYEHVEIGYNYRMSNILAAIGRGQLQVLEERVKRKRDIFESYAWGLGDLPGISFMPEAPWGKCNRWLTVILIDPETGIVPEDVRLALEQENIEARPVWKPMHMQPVFQHCMRIGGSVAARLFQTGLCLPSGTQLTTEDLARIIEAIRRVWKP